MIAPIAVRASACWTADRGAPAATLLPSGQRRRCSLLTRACAEVVGDVLAQTGLSLSDAALVCGTSLGEIGTTTQLLDMMREGDGALSPMRFAGSVHNTALGQLAIASDHRGASTTVSAGEHTVAMALLEAATQLACHSAHVVLVLADEPLPSPLRPPYDGLAVALWLSRDDGNARATLRNLASRRGPFASPRVPAPVHGNPCAPAWTLAAAIAGDALQTVRLQPEDHRNHAFAVDVHPS